MKLFILLLTIFSLSFARQLVSIDDIEESFRKLMRNELTEEEHRELQDVFEILHRNEHASAKLMEYSSPSRMTLDCIICRSAFAAVFEGVRIGQSDQHITEVVTTLCTSLSIEKYNVCSGAVALNVPIITHIIRTTPEAAPGTFCGLVLQNSGNPDVCPYNDARFEWQVALPAPASTESIPPTLDSTPLTIAIITDAHIDPLYEAFGVADCDEPTCCRIGQTPAVSYSYKANVEESFVKESIVNASGKIMLDLSIAPEIRQKRSMSRTRYTTARNSPPAGYWGDYRNCDSPIWAFDDAIERIKENHQDVDVIYYVGDTIDHGVWETTYDLINNMNRYVVEKIRRTFGDNVPVLPVIGNHESQPTNQFAPSTVTGENLNTTWLYEAIADKWDFYLPEEAKATLRERGDFSLLLRPGLRVISVNNNIAYKYNWWLVYDPLDAKRHLDWLVEELFKAEQAGEKVHLLIHIPPGVHDLIYTWTREYNRIVNRFSSVIAAEFNGHTHADEFKIYYSLENGSPINVAWGAGGITSYNNYNLNYKIATFNPQTYQPENIVNYVYNLTEANLTPTHRPHWFELYDMKNTFGVPNLSAASMDSLVYKMVTVDKQYDRQLLDMYSAFFSKLSDARWPYCNDACKIDTLCKVVTTVLWDRRKCEELQNYFYRI